MTQTLKRKNVLRPQDVDHDPLKLKSSVLPMNYAGLGKVQTLNDGIAQDGEGGVILINI